MIRLIYISFLVFLFSPDTGVADLPIETIPSIETLPEEYPDNLTLNGDTIAAALTVASGGTLKVQESLTSFLNGATTVASGGTLAVQGDAGNPTLTLGAALTNAGLIQLDDLSSSSRSATLTIGSGGSLTNTGVIQSLNTGATTTSSRTIDGSLTSTGTVDFDQAMTISLTSAGEVFNTVGGTVDAAATLTVNGGTTQAGLGTVFQGAGSINLNSTQTVNVASDFTLGTDVLAFGGTVTVSGTGTFIVGSGGNLTLNGDTIASALTVASGGTLKVQESLTSFLNGATTVASGGTLAVQGDAGNPTLTLGAALTNAGLIQLDDLSSSSRSATLTIGSGGSLTNTGVIQSLNTGATTTSSRTIDGSLTSTGTVDVDQAMTISLTSAGEVFNTVGGTVDAAATLTITGGTTQVGLGTVFTGAG